MLARFFCFFGAAIGWQVALADIQKGVAACAAKKGELDRLACYDGLARENKLDAPVPLSTAPDGVGKWLVRDTRNPIDDTRTVSLTLFSDSGQSKWNKKVTLHVRCQSNKTELYIDWSDYLGRDGTPVTWRVGSAKARTRSWGNSTDNQATFYPGSPIGLIKEMMGGESFVAQTTPYNENPVTAMFDTRGLAKAIAPLRETCNW